MAFPHKILGTLRKHKFLLIFFTGFIYIASYRPNNIQKLLLYERYLSADYPKVEDIACPIPQLEPYTKVVKEYLNSNKKKFYECQEKYPLLFNSTLDGKIVPVKTAEEFKKLSIRNCCYRAIRRRYLSSDTYDDNAITRDSDCLGLSFTNSTEIPSDHDTIAITCEAKNEEGTDWKIMDMHSFIHVKPEVEKRQKAKKERQKAKKKNKEDVSIIIFGMDAISRMNFIRTLPKSYEYLKKLGAMDMAGFNKVEDNTFPNILPFLANLTGQQVNEGCGKEKAYDSCPFIWKRFKKKGYGTSYAEDEAGMAIFNFERKGFILPPTDYYFRSYSVAANFFISHQVQVASHLCYGPRLTVQVLLDNMKKFVYQMTRIGKPFFQFTWGTGLTHDYLEASGLGDEPLLNALKWMGDYLNNTVFILMSDHGMRVEAFRNSLQGQLEDRLPFAFILLPEWMKKGNYLRAYQNLVNNQKRLVTTFDLHEVLVDFLDIESIQNHSISKREAELQSKIDNNKMPRGISLFLPISKKRTCQMARIGTNYCTCNYVKAVSINDSKVVKSAQIAVKKINEILKPYENCSKLELSEIKMAEGVGQKGANWNGYQVNFQTKPGNGLFEALVSGNETKEWEVDGTISRTNLYRNQSHCVQDHLAKLYCYCNDV